MSLLDRISFRDEDEAPEADVHASLTAGAGPELDPDPEPGRVRRRRASSPAPVRTGVRRPAVGPRAATPDKVRKEIKEELEIWIKLLVGTWGLSCEICGDAAEAQVEPLAESIANLIARSPAMVAKFHQSSLLGDFVKVAIAAKPIAKTALQHKHHAKDHDHEGGKGAEWNDYPAYQPGRNG